MNTYSFKMLVAQPVRLLMTISGIALCIILMLFLLGIYNGVADGSVEYIRKNNADLWVIQKSAENILRGTSILNPVQQVVLSENENVKSVSPVLLVLSTIKEGNETATLFLCGYDLTSPSGGPPHIYKGRGIKNSKEIVLDKAFALKHHIPVGGKIKIMNEELCVTGFSTGTNAFVIQYGFASIDKVHSILGYQGVYTCFLLNLNEGVSVEKAREELSALLPDCSFYTQADFLKNNIKEMRSGILPMLYSIAAISAIVLTTILSLILSINILEKEKDFAVMKILGCPQYFLPGLVFFQSIIIIILSAAAGLIIYFPLAAFIETVSPEITVKNDPVSSVYVVIAALLMGIISSFISMNRLRSVYPLEVFR